MQVNHGINLVFGTNVDDSIKVLEAGRLDDSWVGIILKVSVVDLKSVSTVRQRPTYRNPDTIQSQTGKEARILFREEVLQKLPSAPSHSAPTLSKK
jgi:hypothetical protein